MRRKATKEKLANMFQRTFSVPFFAKRFWEKKKGFHSQAGCHVALSEVHGARGLLKF